MQIPPVHQADLSLAKSGDLVAIIAMDAQAGDPLHLAQIKKGRVVFAHRGSVAGGTDAGPVGMLGEQAPAGPGPAVPVAAVVEVAKMLARGGASMSAVGPFAVELPMTVAAALLITGPEPVF